MDNLSGRGWTPASAPQANRPPPMGSHPVLSDLRPTPPMSGRSTPLSGPSAQSKPPSKSTTPANDSFANLVSFNSNTSGKKLSLLEQQKQLEEQKARQEAEKRAQLGVYEGASNAPFWNPLEKPRTTGSPALGRAGDGIPQFSPQGSGLGAPRNTLSEHHSLVELDDEDDMLAAFNASAPVDASTNFPVPSSSISSRNTPSTQPAGSTLQAVNSASLLDGDNDDLFGFGEPKPKSAPPPTTTNEIDDEDDIFGLLGDQKPDVRSAPAHEIREPSKSPSPPVSGKDKYIAELVDMGFPADKASEALAATESGTDVPAAVGWLLNQAHAEAKEKAKAKGGRPKEDQWSDTSRERSSDRRHPERRGGDGVPAWMRNEERSRSASDRTSSRSPATAEKDAAILAAEFGNNLFKSANSLWKSGTKKMQQAVQEFNAPSDPHQPRWMREAAGVSEPTHPDARKSPPKQTQRPTKESSFTDEAMLLEVDSRPTKPSRPREQPPPSRPEAFRNSPPQVPTQRDMRAPVREDRAIPAQMPGYRDMRAPAREDPRGRLARLNAEEEASQAYISPARRRKAAANQPISESQPNLLGGSGAPRQPARPATTAPVARPQPTRPSAPIPVRPKAPPREIPQVSASVLASSHQYRQKGSEAFKRGDYGAAHASYSSALSQLPPKHPITIVILCNRALTGLKVGEPKSAINDADTAISIIGPSRGESEKVDLGNGEPSKDMREFYGKALMRKAEALEQLERWVDAAKIWRDAVEAGHGGSTSIQGRNRCEKAAGVSQTGSRASTPAPPARPAQPKKTQAPARPAARPAVATPAKSTEAVDRLRAANEAADRADNEKFALADSVDARLTAWKGGKQDNLRALLASLDGVLWPEAGWKKISMAELVLPNKVKVQYMKGIAKVHPDKIPVNATTEQKMIAGAVFSTLNEAWDKFKRENGL
ncbi:hypothetical protein FQN52_008878 [Onygenales sp. PD_12]|nr:hypothetical protein FQN52_008878 [Onygenales sp. PD_12]KAK2798090.1 hypothetical protein FQN51_007909 [Onygenales sp. PD_10]